jgi:polyisoprenoid-binding protein YceI
VIRHIPKELPMSTTQHRTPELPVPAGIWRVDPEKSEIGFAVKGMWGLQTVRGVFRTYDGTLSVVDEGADAELTIEAASLDTGNTKRDAHLRSADFLDVERHQRIVFTTTTVVAGGGGLLVGGDLTVGVLQSTLQIPFEVRDGADGGVLLRGAANLPREAAGLGWNKLGVIRGDVQLHARLVLSLAGA